jgi:hypothetical protein
MKSLFSIFFVMENNIILMDSPLEEQKISLCNPNGIQGGSYITKLKYDNNAGLFIQTPKLNTKQGIISTDKKSYFDIMIDKNNVDILTWIENLEECLQKKIYEKRNSWFETELDMEDIQNTMTPLLRPYKGGKYHLLRVSIPPMKNIVGQNKCAIYDENENLMDAKSVLPEQKVICILEIQGIKFSSKYFQVDIHARQIMVFNEVSLFKSCMIRRPETKENTSEHEPVIIEEKNGEIDIVDTPHSLIETELSETAPVDTVNAPVDTVNAPVDTVNAPVDTVPVETAHDETAHDESAIAPVKSAVVQKEIVDNIATQPNIMSDLDTPSLPSNTLEEISINLENDEEENVMQLKSKEFYYDIYRMALEKAKKAKRQALESFLEAKKIKETYMLEDIENDSLEEDEDLENSDLEEDYEILT